MKTVRNEIVLRPRFQIELSRPKEQVLYEFQNAQVDPFLVSRLDEHIYIKYNGQNTHFWSPRLHLEITETHAETCTLYGIFGPNPTLWTFFMFLHFGVATLFIVCGVWAYSSAALHKPYGLQLGFMAVTVILWFVLYFLGRMGRHKGKPQMQGLYDFMGQNLAL